MASNFERFTEGEFSGDDDLQNFSLFTEGEFGDPEVAQLRRIQVGGSGTEIGIGTPSKRAYEMVERWKRRKQDEEELLLLALMIGDDL